VSDRSLFLLPLLLAIQAATVNWAGWAERPPAPAHLAALPGMLWPWEKLQDNVIPENVARALNADRLFDRRYVDATGGWTADLFIAWFHSQREGASQPYSPQVCLPAPGWTPEATAPMALATRDGVWTIERCVVSNRGSRAVVLYWYQTPRRVLHTEWEASFWVVANEIRDRRTDTSLVRVVVYSGSHTLEETTAAALRFAQTAYPALRKQFPALGDVREPRWVSFLKKCFHALPFRFP